MKYKVALQQSEEGFAVSVPGLPGCNSQGATEQEALTNIADAIREYLEVVADRSNSTVISPVPPEEVERRIDEYRREGFKRRAMPHGVYEDPYIVCPWGDCGYRIAAVDFHIEKMGNPGLFAQVISAWWQGPGIVGRCPGCGRYVLFSLSAKQSVNDPTAAGLTVLPDDWHQYAYIV